MPSGASFRRSYVMHGAIAAGGMATVHVGRLLGPRGFTRRVAIKRLHPQLATNEDIASLFEEEARLSARVAHANVVPVLDVVSADGELLLVMEYVHGESLSRLLSSARREGTVVPIPILTTVMVDVLHGLHAAHEATGDDGAPLRIVHRDVSPQNILVGADGVARVVDFGIAKAVGQGMVTRGGPLRGKIPYMAPEQLLRLALDRRVDVYAAGVVLWEALAGRRLFEGDDEPTLIARVLEQVVHAPSRFREGLSSELDGIAARAIERDPDRRFSDARTMAIALEGAAARASSSAVADWVERNASGALAERQARIDAMEREDRGEAGEPAVPAVRARYASVFLQDAAPAAPLVLVDSVEPLVAGGASVLPAPVLPDPRTRRRRLVLAGAVAFVALVGGCLAFFAGRSTTDAPLSPEVIAGSGSALSSSEPPAPDSVEPPEPASVVVTTAVTGKPPSPIAKGAAGMKWCKVFDPDKRIFVVRPMRVRQCP